MLDFDRDCRVAAGGREWRLAKLTVGMTEEWRDWIAQQIGDPFAALERFLDRLPPEVAGEEFRRARDVKAQLDGFSLSCPLAQEWLSVERAVVRLVHLRLLPHQPKATLDDAFAILLEVGRKAREQKARAEPAGEGDPPPNPAAPDA